MFPRKLDWWYYTTLRLAWVRFKKALHLKLTGSEAIQYAIDTGANTFYIYKGIYIVSRTIKPPSHFKLIGEGEK